MAKNEDDKKDLTNRQLQRRAADLMYAMGNTIGGQRPAGGFASIGGVFAYGTHRDGRPGVLWGGKFVPITRKSALDYGFDSSLYGKGDGNGNGNGNGNDDEDEEKKRNPYKIKDVSFSRRLPAGASWNRTMDTYFPDPNRKQDGNDEDDNNRGPINLEHGMKNGGLVRGAGKAQRGRGRGRMV
jgi:hypothetical protein